MSIENYKRVIRQCSLELCKEKLGDKANQRDLAELQITYLAGILAFIFEASPKTAKRFDYVTNGEVIDEQAA